LLAVVLNCFNFSYSNVGRNVNKNSTQNIPAVYRNRRTRFSVVEWFSFLKKTAWTLLLLLLLLLLLPLQLSYYYYYSILYIHSHHHYYYTIEIIITLIILLFVNIIRIILLRNMTIFTVHNVKNKSTVNQKQLCLRWKQPLKTIWYIIIDYNLYIIPNIRFLLLSYRRISYMKV